MPASYVIDAGRRVVFLRLTGELSDEALRRFLPQFLDDPRVDLSYDRVTDLTGVTDLQLTSETVRWVADEQARVGPPIRRALVVPNPLAFGLARMLGLTLDAASGDFGVFRDLRDAMAFIVGDPDLSWPAPPDGVID